MLSFPVEYCSKICFDERLWCLLGREDGEEFGLLLNTIIELLDNRRSIEPLKAYSEDNFRILVLNIRIFLNPVISVIFLKIFLSKSYTYQNLF